MQLSISDKFSTVPDDCLRCMRDASRNHTTGQYICHIQEDGQRVCGPFSLTERYWEEAALSCSEIGNGMKNVTL